MGGLSHSWHGSGMGLAWAATCGFLGRGTHANMGTPKLPLGMSRKTGHKST